MCARPLEGRISYVCLDYVFLVISMVGLLRKDWASLYTHIFILAKELRPRFTALFGIHVAIFLGTVLLFVIVNLTYLPHDPSIYIKLHHKFDIKKMKKSNWKKLGEKQSILGQTGKIFPICRTWFSMRSTYSDPLLKAFLVSKFAPSMLFRKDYLSTFPPNWNFSIWPPFTPPKVRYPNTTSSMSK